MRRRRASLRRNKGHGGITAQVSAGRRDASGWRGRGSVPASGDLVDVAPRQPGWNSRDRGGVSPLVQKNSPANHKSVGGGMALPQVVHARHLFAGFSVERVGLQVMSGAVILWWVGLAVAMEGPLGLGAWVLWLSGWLAVAGGAMFLSAAVWRGICRRRTPDNHW